MILLSKILPLFVLPVGLTLILIGAGLVLRRRALLIIGAVFLWACSTPAVAGMLARSIEGGAVRVPAASVPVVDAVVVLSTGRISAPGPEAVSEWADADRFFGGLELYRAGRAPIVVFTGGRSPLAPNERLEGDVLAEYAVKLGVPLADIVTTGPVVNTSEEAMAVSVLLKARQSTVPRILLVTSAFHMPRAQALFERAGLTVSAFPVDFVGRAGPVGPVDLLPAAGALSQSQLALREVYGRLYYRLKPW